MRCVKNEVCVTIDPIDMLQYVQTCLNSCVLVYNLARQRLVSIIEKDVLAMMVNIT